MEIRIYKTGEVKKIDIRDTSFDEVFSFGPYVKVSVVASGNSEVDIEVGGEKRIQGIDASDIKDFSGATISANANECADFANAILEANREVDSYIKGDDLSQKSETTSFVHNDSIDNGAAVVLSTEEFKAGVEGNYIEMDSAGTNGYIDFYVEVGGSGTSHKAFRVYGGSLTQTDARIDFLDTTIENLSITSLTEVPAILGTSGQVLAVNSAGNALEFVAQSGGSGGGSAVANLTHHYVEATLGTAYLKNGASVMNFNYTSATKVLNLTQTNSIGSDITWSGNKFTVSADGLYTFNASGLFNTNGIERAQPTLYLYVNGVKVEGAGGAYLRGLISSFDDTCTLNRTLELSANDYVELYAENRGHTSGTSVLCLGLVFEARSHDMTVTGVTTPNTLLGLTDTPATFGSAGQVLAVNSGGTAVEFVNQSGGGGSTNELDGIYLEVFTRSSAYGNGSYEGQIVKYGNNTNLSAGKAYVMRSDGGSPVENATWEEADASSVTSTKGLFGIALGSSASSDGLLVRGIRGQSTGSSPGDIMYISTTSGSVTNAAPSGSGDHVRVIGYALSSTLLYIDPSPDFIELT